MAWRIARKGVTHAALRACAALAFESAHEIARRDDMSSRAWQRLAARQGPMQHLDFNALLLRSGVHMSASLQARPRSQVAAAEPARHRPWRRDWSRTEPPVHWAVELLPPAHDEGASEVQGGRFEIRLAVEDTINFRNLSAWQRRQLFLVLAGKVRPARSELRIAEIFLWDLSPQERRARLFQILGCATACATLNAQASVRDNLTLPLLCQDMQHHEALELVEIELGLLGLAERADWMPRHLSASEYRRAVLGRAAIHSPRLLLYEQPESEMAAFEIGIVRDRLWLAAHEQGCGVLMSTELPQLASLAPTSVWLRQGSCESAGARAPRSVRA
jgi:putative ABC transport system ATP-binding protein